MNINERADLTLRWLYGSITVSSLSFLVTAYYFYKYRSTKAAVIAGSASISSLAFLIPEAVVISAMFGNIVQASAVYTFIGAQIVFMFLGVFYAFHCIISNADQSTKLVVYLSYIWAVVVMVISIACSVLVGSDPRYYDETAYISTVRLMLFLGYSIWGFIAITLLLYFMSNRYFNGKTGSTMSVFIVLILISAVIGTVVSHVAVDDNVSITIGVQFFLAELPSKICNIVTAYYGLTWIQDNSNSRNLPI